MAENELSLFRLKWVGGDVGDVGGGADRASSEKRNPSPLLTDARERNRTAVNVCERLGSHLNTRTNQQKSLACVSVTARERVCLP